MAKYDIKILIRGKSGVLKNISYLYADIFNYKPKNQQKMKKLLFAVLVAAFALTSCGKAGDVKESKIIGTWKSVSEYFTEKEDGVIVKSATEEILSDNAFTIKIDKGGNGVYTKNGKDMAFSWTLEGDKLTMTYTDDPEYPEVLTVEKVTAKEAIVSQTDTYTYDGKACEDYYQYTLAKQ